jgi:hypothetical protein
VNVPDSRITIEDDTAWWVVEHPLCPTHAPCDCGRFGLPFGLPHCKVSCELVSVTGLARALDLDRPCDCTLGRSGTISNCDGTGRHTFALDVECKRCGGVGTDPDSVDHACRQCDDEGSKTLSVHVVEVLPIYGEDPGIFPDMLTIRQPCIVIKDDGSALLWDGSGDFTDCVLPADAAPGEFAVRLKIHKEET